jgi:hypothetical protein
MLPYYSQSDGTFYQIGVSYDRRGRITAASIEKNAMFAPEPADKDAKDAGKDAKDAKTDKQPAAQDKKSDEKDKKADEKDKPVPSVMHIRVNSYDAAGMPLACTAEFEPISKPAEKKGNVAVTPQSGAGNSPPGGTTAPPAAGEQQAPAATAAGSDEGEAPPEPSWAFISFKRDSDETLELWYDDAGAPLASYALEFVDSADEKPRKELRSLKFTDNGASYTEDFSWDSYHHITSITKTTNSDDKSAPATVRWTADYGEKGPVHWACEISGAATAAPFDRTLQWTETGRLSAINGNDGNIAYTYRPAGSGTWTRREAAAEFTGVALRIAKPAQILTRSFH